MWSVGQMPPGTTAARSIGFTGGLLMIRPAAATATCADRAP